MENQPEMSTYKIRTLIEARQIGEHNIKVNVRFYDDTGLNGFNCFNTIVKKEPGTKHNEGYFCGEGYFEKRTYPVTTNERIFLAEQELTASQKKALRSFTGIDL